tara:strand:+ start:633 stop:929 length:297 start_codon:yes stop_codon:yes gene_type:complete
LDKTMERIVRKSITRTINTAQYENLILTVSVEKSLTSKTEKDMKKKIASLTEELIEDYKTTEGSVFDELNLSNKPAYIKNALDSKSTLKDMDFKEIFE